MFHLLLFSWIQWYILYATSIEKNNSISILYTVHYWLAFDIEKEWKRKCIWNLFWNTVQWKWTISPLNVPIHVQYWKGLVLCWYERNYLLPFKSNKLKWTIWPFLLALNKRKVKTNFSIIDCNLQNLDLIYPGKKWHDNGELKHIYGI